MFFCFSFRLCIYHREENAMHQLYALYARRCWLLECTLKSCAALASTCPMQRAPQWYAARRFHSLTTGPVKYREAYGRTHHQLELELTHCWATNCSDRFWGIMLKYSALSTCMPAIIPVKSSILRLCLCWPVSCDAASLKGQRLL